MTDQIISTKTEGAKVIFARPNPDPADLRRRWLLEQGEIEAIDQSIGYVNVKTVRPSRNGAHKVTSHFRIHFSQVVSYLWENTGAETSAKAEVSA